MSNSAIPVTAVRRFGLVVVAGVVIAVLGIAIPACKRLPPKRPRGGHDKRIAVAQPAAAGVEPPPEPLPPSAAPAPLSTIAVAVDHTESMRGFANRNSLEPVTVALEQSLRDQGAGGDRALTYLSMGDRLIPILPKDALKPASFRQGRNDLVQSLGNAQLADADLAVVLTDGQPTGNTMQGTRCSPLGVQDIAALSSALTTALEQGAGVWLVLERVPFEGRVFLNCSIPTQEMKKAIPGLICRRECFHNYSGDRVLLALFIAKKAVAAQADQVVASYLDKRSEATAIRLHPPSAQRWSPDGTPQIHLMTSKGSTPLLALPDTSGQWFAHVPCPSREAIIRVCLRAAPPRSGKDTPLVRLEPPEAQAEPERAGDLVAFPPGKGFDPIMADRLRAWDYQDCVPVWQRYKVLAKSRNLPDRPVACRGEEGTAAAELVLACGCLRGSSTHLEVASLRQNYSNAVEEVINLAKENGFAADAETWHLTPDKINGLSLLLRNLGQRWAQRFQGRHESIASVRVNVHRRATE